MLCPIRLFFLGTVSGRERSSTNFKKWCLWGCGVEKRERPTICIEFVDFEMSSLFVYNKNFFMGIYMKDLIGIDNILIPKNLDLNKWAVIACDQYTSEIDYWKNVEIFVGDEKSTLKLILPEVYLESNEKEILIKKVHQTMNEYLSEGLFDEVSNMVYVERTLKNGLIRKGLVFSIDLENYSFDKNSESLIRPTEGTIIGRIPPRKEIRNNASLELPHVMLLIDDDKKQIIESINSYIKNNNLKKLYDFELMFNSGSLKAYELDDNLIKEIISKFEIMIDNDYFDKKYSVLNKKPILFCVGDGNHSLATAKSYWDDIKENLNEGDIKNHPARYALIELVNLYDESLEFEAIYRLLFNVDYKFFEEELSNYLDSKNISFVIKDFNNFDDVANYVENNNTFDKHVIGLIKENLYKVLIIENPLTNLSFATLQCFLDEFISKNNVKIDYIHGIDSLKNLSKDNNLGFYLKSIQKNDLFKTIIKDGVLPRKTFSMGHAYDKRFYMECRKIIN